MKASAAAMFLILLTGCASPHIGKTVDNMAADGICAVSTFPTSCTWNTENLSIKYTIIETGNPKEYLIEGIANNNGGETYSDYVGAPFDFYIISHRTIVDAFGATGGSGDISSGIKFSKKFNTAENINAIAMGYSMGVRGQ